MKGKIIINEKILEAVNKIENLTDYKKDCVLLFASYLIRKSLHFENTKQMIYIKKEIKEIILGKNDTRKVLDVLLQWKIIEEDRKYYTNFRPKGYRLNDKLISFTDIIMYKIRYKAILNKIDRVNQFYFDRVTSQYPHLAKHYKDLCNLDIDSQAAHEFVSSYFVNEKQGKIMKCRGQISMLDSDYNLFRVNPNNLRLYTKFTNLKSELRQFLFYQDDRQRLYPTYEIDATSSQPVIMLALMKEDNMRDHNYEHVVLNLDIYQYLADKLNRSRKWVKERFMDTLLYTVDSGLRSKNKFHPSGIDPNYQFVECFKKEFPTMFEWIVNKKKNLSTIEMNEDRPWLKKKYIDGGRKLAIMAQRKEAEFWIQSVIP